ncbi:MAG: glutaredoxin domain-containing protein [Terrimicrobiaceae bacterium]|nr:glutaredoxin domain-containing protein [Terrimicrobiaceae bacterium]
MKLYVKTWCPWCIEAIDWLTRRNYRFDQIDVLADEADYRHMIAISGQRKTPTLELPDGAVLPDFDVHQLEKFLTTHNIQPSA